MAQKEIVKQYYDDHTASKLRNYVYGNARVAKAFENLCKQVGERPMSHILEIGCGVGYIASALKETYPEAEVWGFEISEKSIDCANALFAKPGIQFARADTLYDWNCPADLQFDLIVLMDVYEHIPVSERAEVHRWINNHLAPDGMIYLTCPTPAFLAWLKIHQPNTIQPVDEDIRLEELMILAADTGTEPAYYALQQVWRRGDYFHALLRQNSGFHQKKIAPVRQGFIQYWMQRLKNRWLRYLRAKQQDEKKEMIFQKTGIRL